MATNLLEGKLWIRTCSTPLKKWSCVTSSACGVVCKHFWGLFHVLWLSFFLSFSDDHKQISKIMWLCSILSLERDRLFVYMGFMAYQLCRLFLCQIHFYTNKQLHFKQFNLALVHSLIVKNISILSYSVLSNSSNSNNSV